MLVVAPGLPAESKCRADQQRWAWRHTSQMQGSRMSGHLQPHINEQQHPGGAGRPHPRLTLYTYVLSLSPSYHSPPNRITSFSFCGVQQGVGGRRQE